jgi:hypothetical protein
VSEELSEYEHLWTTGKDKYVLVEGKDGGLLPVKLGGKDPMALVIEDDDLASEVYRRMREAGVKVVTSLGS